jgi:hypothetical protein
MVDRELSIIEKVCSLSDRIIYVDAQIESAHGIGNAEEMASSESGLISVRSCRPHGKSGMPSASVTS